MNYSRSGCGAIYHCPDASVGAPTTTSENYTRIHPHFNLMDILIKVLLKRRAGQR